MKTKQNDSLLLIDKKNELSQITFFDTDLFDRADPKKLLSIEVTDEYTRIDFEYISPHIYVNGGWIEMDSNSYIRPVGSDEKFPLLHAVGIPIAPQKHWFKAKGVLHYYTLYFAPIPKNTTLIDIIEKEAPGDYFNFYNVALTQVRIICDRQFSKS